MKLEALTIKKVSEGLKNKEFSCVELTRACLERIKKQDKKIRAFITVTEELALRQAREVDERLSQREDLSVLAGVPLAIKDNILVRGEKCTAGSKILKNYIAPYDATVIRKLRDLGAVFLGKTNLDEFAMGASTENSAFFATHHPYDLNRVPGGSSGGTAAAISAKMCLAGLGSDTGGSIRQPASFCGVIGFKPTYGAVSRYGLVAMSCSLDQIGPMARTVEDARVIFEAIKGKDKQDATSAESRISSSEFQVSNLKIGIPQEYFIKGIDGEVEKAVRLAIKRFEQAGAEILDISLPHTEYAVPVYYLVTPSEISANLARYDGIKYGFSMEEKDLTSVYLQSRGQGFGDEVKRRIMIGTYALSAGYYDAYYLKAQKVRNLIKKDFTRAFEKVDVIMAPVTPTPAFKIGEKADNPVAMYLCDIFTAPVNLAGLPGLSLPCGQTKEGLPIGLQVIGPRFGDKMILETGQFFEELNR